MNILFVINSIEPGGAEVFLLRFAKALKEKGNNVFVLPLRPQQTNNDFLNLFAQAKIPILRIYEQPNKFKELLFWKINAFCSLFGRKGQYVKLRKWDKKKYYQKILSKNKIQIINSHLFEADFFAVNHLKKYASIPVVITMHSSYNELAIKKQENAQKYIDSAESIFQKANFITYLTQENLYIFDRFKNKINTHLQKVYLGYQKPDNLSKSFNKEFTFGMIGRGIPEKGWEFAIQAFEKLQNNYSNIRLVLICPLTDYIQELKTKYASNLNIEFTGYVAQPENYLMNFDLSLLPSCGESLPVSIIESLAFGIPVVASNVGEISNMLKTEDGAIAGKILNLLELGKVDINELTESMETYLIDKQRLENDKKTAFKAAEKFSMEQCVTNYTTIFKSVIKQ